MNSIKKSLIVLLGGAVLLSLGSCASPPEQVRTPNPTIAPTEGNQSNQTNQPEVRGTETPTTRSQPFAASPPSPANAPATDTVTIKIYGPDSQCSDLVAEQVAVPKENSMEAAVGKVIEQQSTSDFSLAGYRVSMNSNNGTATVDLRIAANSQRRLTSLSSCEQLALFGSLRRTLTENPQWQVTNVRFTERGEEIVL